MELTTATVRVSAAAIRKAFHPRLALPRPERPQVHHAEAKQEDLVITIIVVQNIRISLSKTARRARFVVLLRIRWLLQVGARDS
jgi:hypothetical protein